MIIIIIIIIIIIKMIIIIIPVAAIRLQLLVFPLWSNLARFKIHSC